MLWCELAAIRRVRRPPVRRRYLDGSCPLRTVSGGYYDLTTPNPDHFARVDAMINIAASYNIVILLDSFETGGWIIDL